MNVLFRLDLSLVVLGLLAMAPHLWNWLRRRQSVDSSARGCVLRTTSVLLFYFGLVSLAVAGVDVGLAAWEDAHRPRSGPPDYNFADVKEPYMAPDFCLPSLDEDRSIRLSDFRGHKPVVLVFSSFD
jgi:hypothetical protein